MKKIILVLIVVGLAVYFNTLNHSFVWDDHFTIERNEFIKDIRYIPRIFTTDLFHYHAETEAAKHSNYYRPIQTLSFLVDYHIWLLNPFGFHLSNVLLHIANGILVFIMIFSICKSRIISIFTSILFLVHPVQTGAVAYLTGRSDILACFFILSSFLLYGLYYSLSPLEYSGDNEAKRDSFKNFIFSKKNSFYPFSVFAFILALLSKEAAVVFPLILIIYYAAYRKMNLSLVESIKKFLKQYFAYLVIGAIYIILRLTVLNFTPEKKIFQDAINIYHQLLTICLTIMKYIGLLIYPHDLHTQREFPLVTSIFKIDTILSLIGIALLVFLAIMAYRRSRTVFLGMLWFIIFLLPFSNIVPLPALMAEHWLYIPSIGFFLVLSAIFTKLQSTKGSYNFISALFVLLCLFYSYKTVVRNRDWKDDLSIYFATLKYSPKKAKLYYNIGTVYSSRGLKEEAIKFYKLALDNGLKEAVVYTNLAIAYMEVGDFEEAEKNFRFALELDPKEPFAHNGLGALFEKRGSLDEAMSEYKKAVEFYPNIYDPHVNLGVLYDKQDKFKEAIYHFEKALSIKKDKVSYYNLGKAYYRAGDVDKAREIWKEGNINIKYQQDESRLK